MGDQIVNIRRKENTDQVFNFKLGKRLQKLRYEKGYKLEDVQDMVGIRYTLLSNIENGWSRMTIMELLSLAVIYEVKLEDIFEGLWDYIEVSD